MHYSLHWMVFYHTISNCMSQMVLAVFALIFDLLIVQENNNLRAALATSDVIEVVNGYLLNFTWDMDNQIYLGYQMRKDYYDKLRRSSNFSMAFPDPLFSDCERNMDRASRHIKLMLACVVNTVISIMKFGILNSEVIDRFSTSYCIFMFRKTLTTAHLGKKCMICMRSV